MLAVCWFQVDRTDIGSVETEIPLLPLQWIWLHSCAAISCDKSQLLVVINGVKVFDQKFPRRENTPCLRLPQSAGLLWKVKNFVLFVRNSLRQNSRIFRFSRQERCIFGSNKNLASETVIRKNPDFAKMKSFLWRLSPSL